MHRIDGDGNVSGEFTQTPTPGNNATQVTADWLNAVQNEIVNFLETNGVTLDKADNTQFSALMVTLFTAAKKVAGDYEIETVTIPGGTDKKIKITNKQTGKYFTITETRSPDGTTVEATHALGAVADGIDWIFDFSMHNYDAGIMKGVHVLQCFNADTKGAMYWVIRHRPTGETGYGTMQDYYMMKLDETNGLQVNAAASEGVAPTWVKVLTENNLKNGWAGTYGSQLIDVSSSWLIPEGTYMMNRVGPTNGVLEIRDDSGNWYGGVDSPSGLVISDGVNFRINNASATYTTTIHYRKLL